MRRAGRRSDALDDELAAWLAGADDDERAELTALAATDRTELARRFAEPLRFGTAGLRGPEEAGPAGMNRRTVARATAAVAAWLAAGPADARRGVVVGRDARRGSEAFADEAVAVLLGAGVPVLEWPEPGPTPLVPYAVRALGAAAGIMITASHNPPADNGYKLYDASGTQIVPPDDERVEALMRRGGAVPRAPRAAGPHRYLGPEVLAAYRARILRRFAPAGGSDLRIVYTPLHGVGGATFVGLLAEAGFRDVAVVAEQFAPDPAFPTVPFPNPEEPGALDRALALAGARGADLVLANDPDADRLAVAVPDAGRWRALRGDEVGWLLGWALLADASAPGAVVATSVVSSGLLAALAADAGIPCVTTLTGFKWIARAADPGELRFGYEEALGYAVDPAVRDKDGLSAGLALARLAEDLAREHCGLLDLLDDLEDRFGVHAGAQVARRDDAPGGRERLGAVVASLRAAPPDALGGIAVRAVVDLAAGAGGLPPTEGVVLELAGARVVVRPSGTEPKVKAYLEVVGEPGSRATLGTRRAAARERLGALEAAVAVLITPADPR